MEDQSGTKKKKKQMEYEFCKTCNINHNQGVRHKYFPNHKKSLATFLSRFRNKLSPLLKIPSPLTPLNHFWCVFCDQDIILTQTTTSLPCAHAIRHLSSAEHVKNLKHFFWKYGAPADQLDAFMVTDYDLAKWEKRCVARKNEEPSDDIHNELNNFENNVYSNSLKSYPSNDVLPLQCYTNEYQVSSSGLSGVAHVATEPCASANPYALQDFAVENRNDSLPYDGRQLSSDGYSCNKQVSDNGRIVSRESSHRGLQIISAFSSSNKSAGRSVHDGEPPLWLEAAEVVQMQSKPVGKSKKLNPKRVGAAWVEKRMIEKEKEKRGENVSNDCDANWLPNFGRVWQSGSRRESRNEFEREKQNLNVEKQCDMPIKIQPYVSKRMRMDDGADYASG